MTFFLYLFTAFPSWFVGPLPMLDLPPGSPPVYYIGPSQLLDSAPTSDGADRIVVIVDSPRPAPVNFPVAIPLR